MKLEKEATKNSSIRKLLPCSPSVMNCATDSQLILRVLNHARRENNNRIEELEETNQELTHQLQIQEPRRKKEKRDAKLLECANSLISILQGDNLSRMHL